MHNIQVNVIKLEEQIKYCLINIREIFYCIINYAKIFTKPFSGDFTQCRPCTLYTPYMPYAPYTPYASYTSNTQCTLFMQKNDNTAYIVHHFA